MPLYEYKCNQCGKTMELLLSNNKEHPVCKHCGNKDLTRLLSTFSTSAENKTDNDMSYCPTGTCNLINK